MTHTPTPWEVIENGIDNDIIYITSASYPICSVFYSNLGKPDETESNARLIAAAVNSYDKHCGENAVACAEGDLLGEMLEALKSIREYIYDALGGTIPDSLNAIIDRAEGRTDGA